jgi:thioredoxin 1
MSVKSVTDASFAADVLDSPVAVLVDFWAAWCGPCKMMAPMLADLSDEFAGRIAVAKVNIEDSPVTADRYAISSVPTMIIFSDGKPVKTMAGARPRAALVRELSAFL